MKKKNGTYLIFLCWLVYTVAQLGRYSFSANTTRIIEAFSISHADAGLPTTFYFFAYGIGNIVVGLFADRYNKRFSISASLLISVFANASVWLGVPFEYVKYIWAANGLAQAHLWPLMLLTLGQHLDTKKMPMAALVMSTASYGGTFLTYGVSSLASLLKLDFTFVFAASTFLMLAVGALWFATTKTIDEGIAISAQSAAAKKKFTAQTIVMLGMLMLFALLGNAVSGGLKQWVPSILKENFGLEDWIAIFMTVALPLISIVTAFISTGVYKLLKSFILSAALMFVVASLLIPVVIVSLDSTWIVVMILFIIVYVTMGVTINQLSVQAPLYLKDNINTGLLAGLLNGACYMGSALSTYVLGVFADDNGWAGAFNLLFMLTFIGAIIAFAYFFFGKVSSKKTNDKAE